MAVFRCKNNRCPNIDKNVVIPHIQFIFDKSKNKLVVRNKQYCKSCEHEMEYIEEESKSGIEGFCFTRFNTMSSDQKKEVLKKRSQKHFDKHERRDIEERKRQIIEDNRRMAEGRLK